MGTRPVEECPKVVLFSCHSRVDFNLLPRPSCSTKCLSSPCCNVTALEWPKTIPVHLQSGHELSLMGTGVIRSSVRAKVLASCLSGEVAPLFRFYVQRPSFPRGNLETLASVVAWRCTFIWPRSFNRGNDTKRRGLALHYNASIWPRSFSRGNLE